MLPLFFHVKVKRPCIDDMNSKMTLEEIMIEKWYALIFI